MPAGLSLAIALLAAAAPPASGQPAPPSPPESAPGKGANGCSPAPEAIEPGEIFVCAPRPQGYRIDPDLLEAQRAKRSGRPKRPERMADTSCASVGPFGCTYGAGIDLLGAAMVLGTMATKAVRGENVGEMFVTDPQRSEYDHYLEAKRLREAKEAEAAAAAAKAKDPKPSGSK
ncbi:MAG TPA: hypothetical protein VFU20_06060 [Sphingomicrobium sp.]|nr:hypothetical protein [Sphingomicrobium sp.]